MTDKVSSYLALDPGETIGWASFDENGNGITYGQFRYEVFIQSVEELIHPDLKAVITEDYLNHGFMQQKKWSKNITSKVIGKIEVMCELRKVPLVMQRNTVKNIGYMWAGMEPPSNHSISHQTDAFAHGVYYLQSNGIRPVGKTLKDREYE